MKLSLLKDFSLLEDIIRDLVCVGVLYAEYNGTTLVAISEILMRRDNVLSIAI